MARSTRRQVAAENGQVGRSTRTNGIVPATNPDKLHPASPEIDPETFEFVPARFEFDPDEVKLNPDCLKVHPETLKLNPGCSEVHPGTYNLHPDRPDATRKDWNEAWNRAGEIRNGEASRGNRAFKRAPGNSRRPRADLPLPSTGRGNEGEG